MKWAIKRKLLGVDPLAELELINAAVDQRRIRRALTFEEVRKLIEAAHGGGEHKGVSGSTRALVWRLAAEAGLRVSEIQGLRVQDIDLDPSGPALTVRAAVSKNRREARLPLQPELARDLGPYCAGKHPAAPLLGLPDNFRNKATSWLKLDLDAAGIPYQDLSKRVADVHSLRSSFVSELVRRGANAKTVQTLARHATPSMTLGIYARLRPDDERAALARLPSLAPMRVRATGTDGHLAENLARAGDSHAPAIPQEGTKNPADAHENAAGTRCARIGESSIPTAVTTPSRRGEPPLRGA